MSDNSDRDEKGRFKPSNKAWLARSSHGRDPKFETPEQLWSACCEYFQWIEDNPLQEARLTTFQGESTVEYVPKMRAMSIGGLCFFLSIMDHTWRGWRTTRPDLKMVIQEAERIIYDQKFAGAAADLLNANIISRDLGLADKQILSGPDDGPMSIVSREMTPKEAAEVYAATLKPSED